MSWLNEQIGVAAMEAMKQAEEADPQMGAAEIVIETRVWRDVTGEPGLVRRWKLVYAHGEWTRTERVEEFAL